MREVKWVVFDEVHLLGSAANPDPNPDPNPNPSLNPYPIPNLNPVPDLNREQVHLLGSASRGWVIEETLILLPHSTRYVLLSATLPNAHEVAGWAVERGRSTRPRARSRRPHSCGHPPCQRPAQLLGAPPWARVEPKVADPTAFLPSR